ncbi:hypothetical protein AA0114_g11848 [Alternaria tenuissima]|uniref:Uncharacterized protein n=1 Tax=Alternaria tenuissima TaxID=119927 RepID=A0A4Q4M1E9_9PLEO|nr:hypothetical protein AA0114_g11848 [Alternaria tenuissima]
MYKTEEAAEMLLYLHDQQYVFPESLSDDVLLCDVGASVHLFEDPANTGFAFFLRYHANTWTLWNVLLIFESALFLCAWIKKAAVESSGNQACQVIIEDLRGALSMAWSSLDVSDGQPDFTNTKVLAKSVLLYWSRVLVSLSEKPFARTLGQALGQYARSMGTEEDTMME